MKAKLSLILFLAVFISCKTDPNKQIDEGKITENTYQSEEIGWTMEIPKGWTITNKNIVRKRTENGSKILTETMGVEFDTSGLKQLINFQKDRFNIFQSTSEPFELEYEGEWEENNAGLKQLLYIAFEEKGIRADSTATSIVTIDGLEFQSYAFTIYGSKGDVILNQILFSRWINGFDFGVNINYTNEEAKAEMLTAWLNSKFMK